VKSILVTGSNGAIGSAICDLLKDNSYYVIGTDLEPDKNNLDGYIEFDIRDLALYDSQRTKFSSLLNGQISSTSLKALINNAAVQILSGIEDLNIEDFKKTIDINLVAPLALAKMCFNELKASNGSIVNIGSIHSKLTKPAFISYATSKAALLGLTQSLAVDCGESVRVNIIQPAATSTEMLLDSFNNRAEVLEELKKFHPTNSIALPKEIAEIVNFMISDKCQFMNGSCMDFNGGIGVRLHDPG
jgi:NAD(P)-dependent dehydrogenase (short-subunit alcohol dehydrogenase family)